jgi:hypothetical protein
LRDEEATRANIIQCLGALAENDQIYKHTQLLIYYAGYISRSRSPLGWRASDGMIELLIPHDFMNNDLIIHGIPDRTIAVLLNKLAKKTGNRIVRHFPYAVASGLTPLVFLSRRPSSMGTRRFRTSLSSPWTLTCTSFGRTYLTGSIPCCHTLPS